MIMVVKMVYYRWDDEQEQILRKCLLMDILSADYLNKKYNYKHKKGVNFTYICKWVGVYLRIYVNSQGYIEC